MTFPASTKTSLDARVQLKDKIHLKKASLTAGEMAFLSALLIDDHPHGEDNNPAESDDVNDDKLHRAAKVLDNDMLFSIPKGLSEKMEDENVTEKRPSMKKEPSEYHFMVGIWQAFEEGVAPKKLSNLRQKSIGQEPSVNSSEEIIPTDPCTEVQMDIGQEEQERSGEKQEESVASDLEVRADCNDDCNSSDASWDEEENHQFDAWQVLKDEYAGDFGFDYTPDGTMPSDNENELEQNAFQILGTSAEDKSAHPHVLSPPLMDAILNFVPDHIKGQNFWMKYSLVRDGAALETFKQYSRPSKNTVLAIETTKGHVFGCFVTHPWRKGPSFFGSAPSFIFKMRHNRNSPCHCLLDQAQMESEIDVFFLLEHGQRPQLCTSDMLGLGEGQVKSFDAYGREQESDEEIELKHGRNYGFAIALEDDLLSGTTSKCTSYKNPCLVDPTSNGEPFEVLNLELWAFTPCFTLESAEKLEMTQFFVSESIRSSSSRSSDSTSSMFSSRDFYRRIGQGDDHEELREQWQYRHMMDGSSARRGPGATPRFSNA